MNLYTHLIAAAISALLGYSIGYTVRDNSAKETELQIAQTYADALIASHQQEQAWQAKYNQGVQDAREREKKLAADAAAARAAAVSLRHTVAGLQQRLPESAPEAQRDTAGAALALLGECADRYQRVAEAADGHASDAALCLAAWPE